MLGLDGDADPDLVAGKEPVEHDQCRGRDEVIVSPA